MAMLYVPAFKEKNAKLYFGNVEQNSDGWAQAKKTDIVKAVLDDGYIFVQEFKSEGVYSDEVVKFTFNGKGVKCSSVGNEGNIVQIDVSSLSLSASLIMDKFQTIVSKVVYVKNVSIDMFNEKKLDVYIDDVKQLVDFDIHKGENVVIKPFSGYTFTAHYDVNNYYGFAFLEADVLTIVGKNPINNRATGIYNFKLDGYPDNLDFTQINATEKFKDAFNQLKGAFEITGIPEFLLDKVKNDDIAGLNKVYSLNIELFKKLSQARFVKMDESGKEVKDFGKFIINMMQLPFVIEGLTGDDENIRLGTLETDVIAPSLTTDKLPIDFGVLKVPKKFNDLRDFKDVKCALIVPYMNPIELPPELVIGCDLTITGFINCYDGNMTINVNSSSVDKIPIKTYTNNIGFNVPLANVSDELLKLGNNKIDMTSHNGVLVPTLQVKRLKFINVDGEFSTPIKDSGKVANFTGFVKMDDVKIESTKMTEYEKSLLDGILKGGVFL